MKAHKNKVFLSTHRLRKIAGSKKARDAMKSLNREIGLSLSEDLRFHGDCKRKEL